MLGFASLDAFLAPYNSNSPSNSRPDNLLVGSENKIQIGVPMLTELIGSFEKV